MKGKLTAIVEKKYKAKIETPRDYIGASLIGDKCYRKIWYEFKGVVGEEIPLKTRRTFDIGKILEGYIIQLLIDSGINIELPSSFNGYLKFVDPKYPFFQGSCDALLSDLKSILEIKTAQNSSFQKFVNHGLYAWNPRYYSQIQTYMGLSGINSAYILVLNKDNSDIFDEKVDFDKEAFESLRNKAWIISECTEEPLRINNNPLWYECKMCRFNRVCHKLEKD